MPFDSIYIRCPRPTHSIFHRYLLAYNMSVMQLSQRIKQRRKDLNLSQRELAARVGLTPGFLSQIENGQAIPSIESLQIISKELGEPLTDSDYLVEADAKSPVVRRDRRLKLLLPDSDVTLEVLTSDLKQPMDVFMVTLTQEDGDLAAALSPSASEVCIYVVTGQLEIKLGENVHQLGRGDSVYFDGIFLRRLMAASEGGARFTMAITPSIL